MLVELSVVGQRYHSVMEVLPGRFRCRKWPSGDRGETVLCTKTTDEILQHSSAVAPGTPRGGGVPPRQSFPP
jgi:hypothetical protein